VESNYAFFNFKGERVNPDSVERWYEPFPGEVERSTAMGEMKPCRKCGANSRRAALSDDHLCSECSGLGEDQLTAKAVRNSGGSVSFEQFAQVASGSFGESMGQENLVESRDYHQEESEISKIGKQADRVLLEVMNKGASLFTAWELLYVHHWHTKMRWGGSLEGERQLLNEWTAFKEKIERRASLLGDPLALALEVEEKTRMVDAFYEIVKEQPPEIQDPIWSALQAKAK
jgi:hypothetical protein